MEVPVRRIFEQPTIAGLAAGIEQARLLGTGVILPPIERVPRDTEIPVSFAQQRLWFIDQLMPGSPLYNVPTALAIAGPLDPEALQRSLGEILRRHESLRTTFTSHDGLPFQVISQEVELNLPVIDLSHIEEGAAQVEAMRLIREEAGRGYDLERGPLMRASLIEMASEKWILLISLHHIITDGWSMGIMMREMRELYEAYSRGEDSPLPELEVQYGDYAVWQRRWLEGEELGRQMDYWKEKLKSAPPELELPTDYERRALNTSTGGVGSRLMSERVKQGVERLSREEGATSFMGYMAGFQVMMSRYSRQHDISVGTPIANRNRAEIEGVIGLFINTVVIRVELGGRPGYREVMRRVKESALGAYANQDVPFERVVEQMQPERRLDRTPLFQVMMVYQEEGGGEQEMAGMKMMWIGSGEGVAKFDMTLSVVETEAGVGASIEYNRGLFEEATIERMLEHLETLLEEMVEEPERAFEEIGMMSEGERRQLVYENNRARVRRGTTRGVHRIFEKEASRRADAIALVWKEEEISYGELNRRANQLGRYLRQEGVGPEEVVGICLERSVEMVVGMLGVMKAGGAFLPMEATTPASRLSYMVADAGVKLVITKKGKVGWGEEMEARVIELEREREEISRHRVSNIREGVEGENLAYVIYTSGSTGKPKGVGITHANLLPLMKWSREYFGKGEGKRVMENLSPSFDFGVYEIVSTMMGGGKLIIVGREEVMEVGEMSRKVKEWGIEMIHTTPTMMREMRREGVRLEGVEQMHVGGEQMMRENGRGGLRGSGREM